MGSIIDKLVEIETIASRIRESVSFRKQEMATHMEAEKENFDTRLEVETRAYMAEVKSELQMNHEAEVAVLQQEAEQTIARTDAYYQDNHEALAEEIFDKIIRM